MCSLSPPTSISRTTSIRTPNNAVTLLGFDPGLADTGYGVLEVRNNRLYPVGFGCIKTGAGEEMGARLEAIYSQVGAIIDQYRPEGAGVESLFFAKNRTSALPVAQAKGVLLLALYRKGVAVREFPPQEIKQAMTGNGRAEKHQVQEMLKVLLGLREVPKPDHAADALAAAVCYFNSALGVPKALGG